MLISSLAIWYYQSVQDKSSQPFRFFLLGLCLSVFGDVLLMFVESYGEHYFLLGLGAFLLAHLSYICSFVRFPRFPNGKVAKKRWLVIPFLLILIAVLTFLWPYLGSFLFPVSIYSAIIISMALSSYNLHGRTKSSYSKSIFIGAVFFVLSDFTIAFTKFVASGPDSTISSLIIMSTYLLGQFLLCYGMKSALNEEMR